MDVAVQELPIGEKLIKVRLKRPYRRNNDYYERVDGGFGYDFRNKGGNEFLDFATSYDSYCKHLFREVGWTLNHMQKDLIIYYMLSI